MQFENSKTNKQTVVWFLNDENKFIRGNIVNCLDVLKTSNAESRSSPLIAVQTSDGEIIYKVTKCLRFLFLSSVTLVFNTTISGR
jgi:hypothetical protein